MEYCNTVQSEQKRAELERCRHFVEWTKQTTGQFIPHISICVKKKTPVCVCVYMKIFTKLFTVMPSGWGVKGMLADWGNRETKTDLPLSLYLSEVFRLFTISMYYSMIIITVFIYNSWKCKDLSLALFHNISFFKNMLLCNF